MRHLNKTYPQQKPSRNRSSKHLNIILGPASTYPSYLAWGDEQLAKIAKKCKNKANVFQETLDARVQARNAKKRAQAQPAEKKEEAKHE